MFETTVPQPQLNFIANQSCALHVNLSQGVLFSVRFSFEYISQGGHTVLWCFRRPRTNWYILGSVTLLID